MLKQMYTSYSDGTAGTIQFGQHYDCPQFSDFVERQMEIEESVAKLMAFLDYSRIYTEKKTTIFVSFDSELNDYVIYEAHPDDLKEIDERIQECDIYSMIDYIKKGFVGKVICEGSCFECCKFYISL